MNWRRLACYYLFLLVGALRLAAHDYWFEPSRRPAAPGRYVPEWPRAPAGEVAADGESFWAAGSFLVP
jgi:hypothetical protein